MSHSRIFLFFCLAFIGGIFLNSFFNFPFFLLFILLIFALLLIAVFWRRPASVIGFCFLFLLLGIWRYEMVEQAIINNKLRQDALANKKVDLIGQVAAEPDRRITHLKLIVKVNELKGKILITTDKYPVYQYGDQLKISGQLAVPAIEAEDFAYQNYLLKDGIYATMFYPAIEVLAPANYKNLSSLIYAKILNFKERLRNNINQNLSPPASSILSAMLLGDKGYLSPQIKEKLNLTGLRHITAISGLHITILSVIFMQFLIGLGFWRRQAFYLTLIFLIGYLIMIGLPASATRAVIMAGLLLLAQYWGRSALASRTIILAAALMLFINPLLLKLDIGFQLSFLAVMGIIYLNPFFKEWFGSLSQPTGLLEKLPDKIKKFLTLFYNLPYYFFLFVLRKNQTIRNALSTTLAAQIFTLPILVYNFGYVSSVAPLVNLLIVPLLPFILLTGLVFVLAGVIYSGCGWILSWPVWLLLAYLIKIVDYFAHFPPAFLPINWFWLVIFYFIFGLLIWQLCRQTRLIFLRF
ncbi:MAG: ComEC/Rec2 family competence protein [Minisyncoccales bacterium]